MKLGIKKRQGVIAILDALGVSFFDENDIPSFLNARKIVLELLKKKQQEWAEGGRINATALNSFTFNDTLILSYYTDGKPDDKDIQTFFLLLRHIFARALHEGILFRGAVSIGDFFVEPKTNTILGPAVTDAAAWYDKADWIGVLLTPKATLDVKHRREADSAYLALTCVEYQVPLKNGTFIQVCTLNWQTLLAVHLFKDVKSEATPKAWLMGCMLRHRIPSGTEGKYTNSLRYYDYCAQLQRDAVNLKSKT